MYLKKLAVLGLAGLALPTMANAQSSATRADLECLAFYAFVDAELPQEERDSEWETGIGGIFGHYTTRIMERGELAEVTPEALAEAKESATAGFDSIGERCIAEADALATALEKLAP